MRTAALFVLLTGCFGKLEVPGADTGAVGGCDAPGTMWLDADGDGFGDPGSETTGCDGDDGLVDNADDCDDTTADISPDAPERCNEVDDDCDGGIDEDVLVTWYGDADGDGYGVPDETAEACEVPDGFAPTDDDCDDADPAIHPFADEVCNGVDDDCDVDVDEDAVDATDWYLDDDGDGFGAGPAVTECTAPTSHVETDDDCDDLDPEINPGALERCNGADDDCDGTVDEDDAADAATWYLDADGDGYGVDGGTTVACDQPSGYAATADDCDDFEVSTNPGATEACDGADNDCDGDVDEGVLLTWYRDADGDGYGTTETAEGCTAPSGYVASSGDCDDTDAAYSPGATAGCDGEDYDCDGSVDSDADGDGHADATCGGDDCDDTDAAYNPGAALGCDGEDYDCDGYVDNDADLDGYTDAACGGDDCDDSSADYNPGATPGCDGEDYDCDGSVDNDADGDGYADASCGGDDCDDSDATVLPDPAGGCALGTDCDDILTAGRGSTDGVYTIDPDGWSSGTAPFDVTCDMTTDGGGWTNVEDADFSVDSCPSGWATASGYGACTQPTVYAANTASAWFDTMGITYSEVYGAAAMSTVGTPDGFHGSGDITSVRSISGRYVDGMSLTHGTGSGRTHIFSYGFGYSHGHYSHLDCPGVGGISPPSFVGSDYLCTSNASSYYGGWASYGTASFGSTTWQVALSSSTTDDIQGRLMGDEATSNEIFYVETLELWIR